MWRLNTSFAHHDSRVINVLREIQRETEDIVFSHLACHGVMQPQGCIDLLQTQISPLVYLVLLTQESVTMLLPGKLLIDIFLV